MSLITPVVVLRDLMHIMADLSRANDRQYGSQEITVLDCRFRYTATSAASFL